MIDNKPSKNKHNFRYKDLSPQMQELSTIIGLNGVATLVYYFGGTRIFIPKNLDINHKLASHLGVDYATKLSKHCGGNTLSIGTALIAKKHLRNLKIYTEYKKNVKIKIISFDYDLTERQIHNIINKIRIEKRLELKNNLRKNKIKA